MDCKIAIIVPVFNRPEELKELLQSLVEQSDKEFEVVVIEDGSSQKSDFIVAEFQKKKQLSIKYFYKQNSGPGNSRNYGCVNSDADFFVFFDSDCVIPPDYIKRLNKHIIDLSFFGGPDKEHESFTPIQKSISYSMTSLFTTGGIRGHKKSMEKFHPRSFNMGFSKEVFYKSGGFSKLRFGEDIDLSMRIFELGYHCKLIRECFVYHKRRTDYGQFFKQVFNSGIARINLYKRHPKSLKFVHFLPAIFVIYQLLFIPHAAYRNEHWVLWPTLFFLLILLVDASVKAKSMLIGVLSVWASLVQLFGYGLGFIIGFVKRVILKHAEFHAFENDFYD